MPPTPWQTLILAPAICAGAAPLNSGANDAHFRIMQARPVTVAETPTFIRQAADLWSDEELSNFVDFIARNPEVGELIPGSGGVRKIRWTRRGMGKRSGVRIVYFYHDLGMPLYLLMIYAKARRDDLSPDAKRTVEGLVARLKQACGR
ncbi:MAG TPA: addiction module toxin RelE [Stellaceae bacterium]|nr:addiction module toxin RelE [Stellaceae bacterium]